MASNRNLTFDSFELEQVIAAPRNLVFAAFSNMPVKRSWFAESKSHKLEHYALDCREGGVEELRYRMGDDTPIPGMQISSEAVFLDVVPIQESSHLAP